MKSAVITGNRSTDERVLEALLRTTPFEFVIGLDQQVDVYNLADTERYTYVPGQSIAVTFTQSGWVVL